VDAAEADDVRRRLGRLLAELERVTHEVGEILDLRLLVVVGQEHGVALLLEPADLVLDLVGGRDVAAAARDSVGADHG
jgi:hypothetical protein